MTEEDIIKLGRMSGFIIEGEKTVIAYRLEHFANLIELNLPTLKQIKQSKTLPEIPSMTMRDYFAAKAMQGLMDAAMPMPEIAEAAYQMADDMMKARGDK